MTRKVLTILSLIGLLLSVAAWILSGSGGWSHTHFYTGQGGEETGITFICGDGRIGWDETSEMSLSVLSPEHGVSLWLPTLIFAGSFLLSLLPKHRMRVQMLPVGVTLSTLPLIGLLLSLGLWAMSYFHLHYNGSSPMPRIELLDGCIRWNANNFTNRDIYQCSKVICGSGLIVEGFRGLNTYWFPHVEGRLARLQSIRVPLWIPVFACASLYFSVVHLHFRRRKKLGLCLKCGYDLRGSEERCPECGMEFKSSGV